MDQSVTPENPKSESLSPASGNSSTPQQFGRTNSEKRLISLWQRAGLSGSDLPATEALSLLAFMAWAGSLRLNIYDLQTTLMLFGKSCTPLSKAAMSYEMRKLRSAFEMLEEEFADVQWKWAIDAEKQPASPDSGDLR